jgi:RNA polymerase sigma-70 factor (ECF subfamily)
MYDCRPSDIYLQQFLKLFEIYKAPVYDYVYNLTRNPYAAEEITQELFIKLWKRKDKLADIGQIDQYIFRMAHNACMTWFLKLGQNIRLTRALEAKMKTAVNDVADNMDYNEAKHLVQNAIAALSPRRKYVYELSRNEGLKIQEIADRMGLSFDTVKHHLTAALSQIRKQLILHKKS